MSRSDERRNAIEKEIVEAGTRLPANLENVLESGGGDQGHARALSLQQRIGANGGAVQQRDAGLRPDFSERFGDGARRIVGRGEYF